MNRLYINLEFEKANIFGIEVFPATESSFKIEALFETPSGKIHQQTKHPVRVNKFKLH